jgi:hypothetical protein
MRGPDADKSPAARDIMSETETAVHCGCGIVPSSRDLAAWVRVRSRVKGLS